MKTFLRLGIHCPRVTLALLNSPLSQAAPAVAEAAEEPDEIGLASSSINERRKSSGTKQCRQQETLSSKTMNTRLQWLVLLAVSMLGSAAAQELLPPLPEEATDGGGIIRYSYCDPSFTMGTLMTEARPVEDWTAISAQARWQGVIFAGDPESRIVPVVIPHRTKDVLNGFWSVQSKGRLITQKLKESKGGGDMVVWVSDQGLGKPVTADGVVFVEAKGAYAAIRVAGSTFRSTDNKRPEEVPEGGSYFVPEDEFAPVIIEVMAREKAGSFGDFKARVLACKPVMNGPVLGYRSIYGDEMTFDTGYKQLPSVNGKAIDYAPPKVFESPFLNADYNSGVVTISKGTHRSSLDFNRLVRE